MRLPGFGFNRSRSFLALSFGFVRGGLGLRAQGYLALRRAELYFLALGFVNFINLQRVSPGICFEMSLEIQQFGSFGHCFAKISGCATHAV